MRKNETKPKRKKTINHKIKIKLSKHKKMKLLCTETIMFQIKLAIAIPPHTHTIVQGELFQQQLKREFALLADLERKEFKIVSGEQAEEQKE